MSDVLADAVVVVHFAFVVFVVFGGWLALRWPRLVWLHLPALAWGIWIEFSGGICPLTPIENALRAGAGEAGYAGSFVERYIVPLVYPPGLTSATQQWLGGALVVMNLAAYAVLVALRNRQAIGSSRRAD